MGLWGGEVGAQKWSNLVEGHAFQKEGSLSNNELSKQEKEKGPSCFLLSLLAFLSNVFSRLISSAWLEIPVKSESTEKQKSSIRQKNMEVD